MEKNFRPPSRRSLRGDEAPPHRSLSWRWGWVLLLLAFSSGMVLGVRVLLRKGGDPGAGRVATVDEMPGEIRPSGAVSPPPVSESAGTVSSGGKAPRSDVPAAGGTAPGSARNTPSPSVSQKSSLRITAPPGFDVGSAGRTDPRSVAEELNDNGEDAVYKPPRIVADIAEQLQEIVETMDSSTLRLTKGVLEKAPFLELTPEKAELRPSGGGVTLRVTIPADSIALKGKAKPLSSEQQPISKDRKTGGK